MSSRNFTGSILAAVAIFGLFAFVLPLYNELGALQTAMDERSSSIIDLRRALDRVDSLGQDLDQRMADVNRLKNVISQRKSADEIVSALDSIANQSGVQLVNFSMGEGQSTGDYNTATLNLNLNGSYPSLKTMFSNLENSLRLFDVTNMSVSPLTESAELLSVNLSINVYYLE